MFVSNTCTLIGQINVSFVKWRCLGVCRQIVGFCWVVSNSGPELNWHWQWSGDQFNSMVNEIFSRDCYQQVPDFVGWSRKIHVCCCRAVKKRFDCTVVMSSRLNSYQLFRTRIVPGIETLSHLNSYRSEFVQWYSPIVFNFTGFTGSQSWNIDNLIDT